MLTRVVGAAVRLAGNDVRGMTFSTRARRPIAIAAGVAALAYAGLCLLRIFQYRYTVPVWDMLSVEWFLDTRFLPRLDVLTAFDFHDNEHRPVFPLYIFAVDHLFFSSRGLFLTLCSLLAVAGLAVVCLHRLVPATGDPLRRYGYALLLPCVLLLSLIHISEPTRPY